MQKKKIIIFGVIAILIIGLLGYALIRFIAQGPEGAPVCPEGTRLDFTTKTCVEFVEPTTPEEINFDQTRITIPGNEMEVTLEMTQDSNGDTVYSATFEDTDSSSTEGYVLLNQDQAAVLEDNMFLIPFAVSFGGTGTFVYVGLFSYDGTVAHQDSILIDDRIAVDSIVVEEDMAFVHYDTRAENEPYVATPSIPAEVAIRYTAQDVGGPSIEELMRLENASYKEVEFISPTPNSSVTGELTIRGALPSSWYVGGTARFTILDEFSQEIAFGNVTALSSTNTTQRVPFETKLRTSALNYAGPATIVIESGSASSQLDAGINVELDPYTDTSVDAEDEENNGDDSDNVAENEPTNDPMPPAQDEKDIKKMKVPVVVR